ncbi:hypothetical protein ACH4F6_35950 [Streptomyces sp. NPDC017936]|uniref:hypothetical protein n=1 Tax=Streptomyces sp. NPDC017936 TaxID=3365016 RepID=UPI00378AF0B3
MCAALFELVVRLRVLLRQRSQAARVLILMLTFAGSASWGKTRRLKEPSARNEGLRAVAY